LQRLPGKRRSGWGGETCGSGLGSLTHAQRFGASAKGAHGAQRSDAAYNGANLGQLRVLGDRTDG
jgi:hypothetical protein